MARNPRIEGLRSQIISAFTELGGTAPYQTLYAELGRVKGRPLTVGEKAGVRREIENHSSDSENYRETRSDLFFSVGGLRSGHWGLRAAQAALVEFREGERQLAEVTLIRRSQGLVAEARRHYGLTCAACGFNFQTVYGKIGQGFIEVHHLEPISQREDAGPISVQEVAVLCSNCHRMIHTSRPPLTIAQLQEAIQLARQ